MLCRPTARAKRCRKGQWRLSISLQGGGASRPQCSVRSLPDSGQANEPREKLCSFSLLDIQIHSGERADKRDRGGSGVGAKYIVRGHDTTQTVLNKNIKREEGNCSWSPSREGARGQSSSACRGLPSEGEACAIHHQPAPALTLTTPCFVIF